MLDNCECVILYCSPSIDLSGGEILGYLVMLLAIGLIGGKIFGWGGWTISDNHIYKETGCFSTIVVVALILLAFDLWLGTTGMLVAIGGLLLILALTGGWH